MESTAVQVVRVAPGVHWHALADDEVVGRGHASTRPDGRVYLSIDCWHDAVFDRLAAAMLADLPTPLHVLVDQDDHALLASWECAGFTLHRREYEYVLPTDPEVTGLHGAPAPRLTVLPVGQAEEGPLRELDRLVRAEVAAGPGWQSMPAQLYAAPDGSGVLDPSRYAVAVRDGQYVGLARIAPLPRQPRLGLVAVRADHRRCGIARALLAEVLGSLHRDGIAAVSAEVVESNAPARALVEGIGARHTGTILELLRP